MDFEKIIQDDKIIVKFPGGCLGRYPGPSGGEITIPLKGRLPRIPDCYKSPDWEIRELWIEERREKIAYAYQLKFYGSDDAEDFYAGPFAIEGGLEKDVNGK